MCEPISIITGIAAAATVASQQSAAKKTAAATEQASAQAATTARETAATNKAAADKSAFEADQANNLANGKKPDVNAIASRNALDAKGGIGSTMLTGPQGVDPATLLLGKTTLLGG